MLDDALGRIEEPALPGRGSSDSEALGVLHRGPVEVIAIDKQLSIAFENHVRTRGVTLFWFHSRSQNSLAPFPLSLHPHRIEIVQWVHRAFDRLREQF